MAHILVIDDDKDIQRLLEFTLKRAGHTVNAAPNGEQGLQYAVKEEPELIVCDVMMPKMTGYEFCRRAREKENLKNTPIIIFSARFQPVDRQTALDAGATDYLPKSTAPDALVKRIDELLSSGQPKKAVSQSSVAIFSLRGGVGATTLAVNLAVMLALSTKSKTLLLDLAQMGGHAALMMGLRPTSHFSKLLASANGNFTPDTIKPHLIQHQSGALLLASPPSFDQPITATDNQLAALLKSLRTMLPITILDTPNLLQPPFSPLLDIVDRVLLLISPDMPSVQSTAIALQGLNKLKIPDKKIDLIVNQNAPHNKMPIEVIQKAIKRPVLAAIPFDAGMSKAINSGKPFVLTDPKSATSRAINQLATKLQS